LNSAQLKDPASILNAVYAALRRRGDSLPFDSSGVVGPTSQTVSDEPLETQVKKTAAALLQEQIAAAQSRAAEKVVESKVADAKTAIVELITTAVRKFDNWLRNWKPRVPRFRSRVTSQQSHAVVETLLGPEGPRPGAPLPEDLRGSSSQ
jgi:hypothetical protein